MTDFGSTGTGAGGHLTSRAPRRRRAGANAGERRTSGSTICMWLFILCDTTIRDNTLRSRPLSETTKAAMSAALRGGTSLRDRTAEFHSIVERLQRSQVRARGRGGATMRVNRPNRLTRHPQGAAAGPYSQNGGKSPAGERSTATGRPLCRSNPAQQGRALRCCRCCCALARRAGLRRGPSNARLHPPCRPPRRRVRRAARAQAERRAAV